MNPGETRGQSAFRTSLLGIGVLLVTLPFLVVRFVPSADLPQHLALAHRLAQSFHSGEELYRVLWYAPNTLIYGVALLCHMLFPPIAFGRILLALLCISWSVATFALASARGRSLGSTLLAGVFVFNVSLYWGLLSFMLGWPLFVLWLLLIPRKLSVPGWMGLAFLSALLYATHALWFLVACACLLVESVASEESLRDKMKRISALLPMGLVAAFWFFQFSGNLQGRLGADAPFWSDPLYYRLSPAYPLTFALGGLRGLGEVVIYSVLGSWVLLGIYLNTGRLRQKCDLLLLRMGLVLLLLSIVLPDQYMNTIFFAQRWVSPACILIFLGLPAPLEYGKLIHWYTSLVLVGISLTTTMAWRSFERNELTGLQAALDLLPENKRLLGLDFVRDSAYIRGRPFMHISSYAALLKDAETHFSFAEHASIPLKFTPPFRRTWTAGLEWFPERAMESDYHQFDFALIGGSLERHLQCMALPYLRAITNEGIWRLYQIVPDVMVEQHRSALN